MKYLLLATVILVACTRDIMIANIPPPKIVNDSTRWIDSMIKYSAINHQIDSIQSIKYRVYGQGNFPDENELIYKLNFSANMVKRYADSLGCFTFESSY